MRRAPLILGQCAELRVRPRQRRQPTGRFAVGTNRLMQDTRRGEVVHQAELIQPLVDRRRHRGVVASRVRPSRQAKLLQERGELGSCEGLRKRGELGRVTAVVRTGAEVMLEEHFGLLSRAAAYQDMALIGAEQDGNLQRRTLPPFRRGIVEQLVAGGEPQLIAGGDQDRLADQLALQDRLARALDVFQLPTRFRAPEHDHRVGVTPLADAEGHERSACLGPVRGDGDRPDPGRHRGRVGGARRPDCIGTIARDFGPITWSEPLVADERIERRTRNADRGDRQDHHQRGSPRTLAMRAARQLIRLRVPGLAGSWIVLLDGHHAQSLVWLGELRRIPIQSHNAGGRENFVYPIPASRQFATPTWSDQFEPVSRPSSAGKPGQDGSPPGYTFIAAIRCFGRSDECH